MSKTKKIVLVGLSQTDKSAFYQKIVKKYALNKTYIPQINELINYTENLVEFQNNYYLFINPPNFIFRPRTEIEKALQKQNTELIQKSDLILWITNASQPIGQAAENLNKFLTQFSSPKILILNNLELAEEKEYQFSLFQRWEKFHLALYLCPFSTQSFVGEKELIEKIVSLIPSPVSLQLEKNIKTKIVIFGPPNSGKSTLLNCLLKKNRSLVSTVAGTTQEPVKDYWNWREWTVELVDTAGISKNLMLERKIYQENKKVFRQCELAWVIIDATSPLTKQIFQIIHLAEEYQKPLIIIINKYDLIDTKQKKAIQIQIYDRLKSLRYAPVIFISALTGKGTSDLLEILSQMLSESQKNFTKKGLDREIESMLVKNPPKHKKGKLKIYFAKHQSGLVHFFVFFVNNPQLVHFSYQRYISNCLRKSLDLKYLPIKLIFKRS